ncbi:unnamed protein product [Aspergillus oryzae RIB40]|uniref:DNA, SC001 n=1 Tax=Aspergillus oryzae (strain ATCC 42149 / RIB 40) TaxID=510516 RepID=Q2UP58_ASPOR|nr:unnamed protein product [Aspergillus oryzae RIB40]BAE56657.1 unnamed protein product [Aspergillus oryzae RIB40]
MADAGEMLMGPLGRELLWAYCFALDVAVADVGKDVLALIGLVYKYLQRGYDCYDRDRHSETRSCYYCCQSPEPGNRSDFGLEYRPILCHQRKSSLTKHSEP